MTVGAKISKAGEPALLDIINKVILPEKHHNT